MWPHYHPISSFCLKKPGFLSYEPFVDDINQRLMLSWHRYSQAAMYYLEIYLRFGNILQTFKPSQSKWHTIIHVLKF